MVKTPEARDEARAAVAAELRSARDGAREASGGRTSPELPPLHPTADVAPSEPPVPSPTAPPVVRAPDNGPVNELWQVPAAVAPRGLLFRLIRRVIAPIVDAQVAFNSRQVELDNQLLEYVEARLTATHRHYDLVLGQYGQHITDANERHFMLQRELITHVHDLVKRIDIVLMESERGRLSLDVELREVRARLVSLEERVRN
jgi:hypothetical protein